jgi:hypothetical protein
VSDIEGARIAELVRAGDDMAEALKNLWTGLFAIKPHLDKPYPEDPRWTPWSRFVEHELDLAMTARETWQEARTDG